MLLEAPRCGGRGCVGSRSLRQTRGGHPKGPEQSRGSAGRRSGKGCSESGEQSLEARGGQERASPCESLGSCRQGSGSCTWPVEDRRTEGVPLPSDLSPQGVGMDQGCGARRPRSKSELGLHHSGDLGATLDKPLPFLCHQIPPAVTFQGLCLPPWGHSQELAWLLSASCLPRSLLPGSRLCPPAPQGI